MSPSPFQPPRLGAISFNCPHCRAFAQQQTYQVAGSLRASFSKIMEATDQVGDAAPGFIDVVGQATMTGGLALTQCVACHRMHLWVRGEMVWPSTYLGVPPANADLPPEVMADYNEAASVVKASPRAAGALLRLAIEKLCRHVGESGDINAMIGALVKKGLDERLQQALDYVRVVGNEAVHPGQMDLKDDVATASTLFGLVNLIADRLISEPKHVAELYATLPPGKLAGIEARDKPKP